MSQSMRTDGKGIPSSQHDTAQLAVRRQASPTSVQQLEQFRFDKLRDSLKTFPAKLCATRKAFSAAK